MNRPRMPNSFHAERIPHTRGDDRRPNNLHAALIFPTRVGMNRADLSRNCEGPDSPHRWDDPVVEIARRCEKYSTRWGYR
jgi:hypothetical protein